MEVYINVIERPTGKMLIAAYTNIIGLDDYESEALRLVEEKYPEIVSRPTWVIFEKYEGVNYESL